MREYINTMINWVIKIRHNKYSKWYEALIEKAKNRSIPKDTYTETHHIVPYCISKDNSKNNLVVLTAREHYIAHLLLWRMDMPAKWHNKMMMALWVMTNGSGNSKQKIDRSKLKLRSSRLYERFMGERRRITGEASAERWKNPEYKNNVVTQIKERWNEPEYKARMSKIHKERMNTPEAKEATSNFSKQMWNNRSQEEREEILNKSVRKIAQSRKGKTYEEIYTPEQIERLHNGRKNRVLSEDAKERMKQGRLKGIRKPKTKKPCPHCGKMCAGNMLAKWHGDNCKLKPTVA
jgi:hypothetical protein